MTGDTTGQVLGAATTGVGAAVLPATLGSNGNVWVVLGSVVLAMLSAGLIASVLYKKLS